MSSPQPETETHEVTLSRDEQWVVHSVLASEIDGAIDDDESPAEWTLEALETLETAGDTAVFTAYQAQTLVDRLTSYLARVDTPEDDIVHGSAVVERLETRLESRESPPQ